MRELNIIFNDRPEPAPEPGLRAAVERVLRAMQPLSVPPGKSEDGDDLPRWYVHSADREELRAALAAEPGLRAAVDRFLDEYAGALSHASLAHPHGMIRVAIDDIAKIGAALASEPGGEGE